MLKQKTLKGSFSLNGKGLHTGVNLTVTFNPAPDNHGYKIQRIDLEGQPIIDAVAENVGDTTRGTVLMKNGIKVVANNYASSNVDMPTMPLDILSVFNNDNSLVVFDVGGDDDGALALGQYKQYFDKYGYEMHFIVNTKRPLTRTNDELIEIAERIESASRLKFTDIYNNTNLSDQTDETTLFSGYDEIKMLSKKMGIVITKNCGIDKALSNVPTNLKDTVFRMNICILRPWEIQ